MLSINLQIKLNKLRSNKAFELFVISIIIFSALVIGAKTYDIPPGAMWLVSFLDWFITFIFLTEIIIRFLGEEKKKEFFKQGWNIFDTLIVITSLIPIEDSELAIVGRLIRIFRVLRMVSIIPELKMLLNSLLIALPQLAYIVALMFIIFYIYAAIGSTFFATINPVLWGDIAISMLTLFRVMTFEDWTDIQYETMEVYPLSWIYYITFIFFTAFAFLNMVIGVVVNVLNEEHEKVINSNKAPEPTNTELQQEIRELKHLLSKRLTNKNHES
jgi:voltage-gated sodium channel